MENKTLEQTESTSKRPGHPEGKRQQKRRKRLETFFQVTVELALEKGLEVVTIEEITSGAGVSKGSFYRYFRNKEDLLTQAYEPLHTGMKEAFETCAETLTKVCDNEGLKRAYETFAADLGALFFEHMGLMALYLQESRGPSVGARQPLRALGREMQEKAIELTELAHTRGVWKPISPRVSALSVIGAVETLLFETLQGNAPGNPLEVIDDLIVLILRGLEKE